MAFRNLELDRTETYSQTEHRTRQVPNWNWRSTVVTYYESPAYTVYKKRISPTFFLVLYKLEKFGNTQYFWQNAGYWKGADKKRTNYILVDANSNGTYNDEEDHILFNTWNPRDKNSRFTSSKNYSGNTWYKLSDLKEQLFLATELNIEKKVISLLYANATYAKSSGKGKVTFVNLPSDADLSINGARYKTRKSKNVKFKSEYGFFKVTISSKESEDFEKIYEINESNNDITINYDLAKGAVVILENLPSSEYMAVKIMGENGYSRMYTQPKSKYFNVPLGKITVIVSALGVESEKKVEIKSNEDKVEIDFLDIDEDSLD